MIKDNISEYSTYCNISDEIKNGFEWINNTDLSKIADGKYTISDKIYANVQTYNTKEDALFEAHRDYIDIQYMINGTEKCGICNYKDCKTAVEYDKEKDIEFLESAKSDFVTLNSGEFLIFFPQDAHKPALSYKKEETVKKVVVKVKV